MSGVSATSSELLHVQQSKELFEKAESVEDLKRLTIAFLRGELSATSYHYGPLLAESSPLIESLVKLNELGFITTASQPGGMEMVQGRRIQKRFYVEGVVPKRYLALLTQGLYTRLGYNVFLASLDSEHSYDEIQALQAADTYWVSRYVSDIAKKDQGLLHISEVNGPCQMFQTCDEVYAELVDDYVSIFIMDTRWGHGEIDVLNTLLSVLGDLIKNAQKNKFQ